MFALDVVTAPTFLHPNTPMWDQPLDELRAYDENLVKPLVLFADRITLRSERMDMLSLIHSSAFQTSRMPMRRVWRYIGASTNFDPTLLARLDLPRDVLADRSDVDALMASRPKSEDAQEAYLEALERFERKYASQIEEFSRASLAALRTHRDQLLSPALESLAEAGILDITGWSTGDSDAWSLAWQEELDFLVNSIDDVASYLRDSEGAVMLEPGSAFFLDSDVSAWNTSQPMHMPAHLASAFVSRLPGLRSASLGELLEVRDELDDYLVPFRAVMATMAKDVSDAVGESPEALAAEIEKRWVREVAPVLHELAVRTKRGGYPRELINVLTEDKGSMASAASSIVLAAGSTAAGLAALVPAAAAAAYPFAKALKEVVEGREMRQDNQLFFLYSAQKQLRNRI